MSPLIANLEKMLAAGRDDALLRFSLGNEYLKNGEFAAAAQHLGEAVRHDPLYSAAWKLLGKALTECGKLKDALNAYQRGIEVAEKKGDKQAAKEMQIFARRIEIQLRDHRKPQAQQ
ncbi:MAG TPA: tetratricopeptide repeat protein [Burkholderiales bacterium]|nr:tetratricopeptide repeat protein [Burkholderiales bacterium]